MNRKNKFIVLYISFFIIAFFSSLSAQQSKIGDFDINKVIDAVGAELNDSITQSPDNTIQEEKLKAINQSYLLVILRIIAYLALLTVIIMGGVWLIKRLGLSGSSRVGGGSMDLLEALPVGQNKSVILVRVLDNVFVLSQTPQQITLLEKIEGDKAIELISSTKGGTSIVQFKDMFNNFMGKIKKSS